MQTLMSLHRFFEINDCMEFNSLFHWFKASFIIFFKGSIMKKYKHIFALHIAMVKTQPLRPLLTWLEDKDFKIL